MKLSIRCCRRSVEVKLPRRRSLLTGIENQISIWLSQEACWGAKWKVMRWLPSRRNVSGVTIDWRMPDFPFSPRSSLMLQRSATKRTTPSDMWVLRLSQTTFHGAVGGARRTDCPGTTQNLPRSEYLRWSRGLCRGDIKRGDQGFFAMPDILELPPFDVSRLHRQARRSMFQC